MKKSKIGFISLGCPKNQVDTEVMLRHIVDAGYEIVDEDIKADILIINTCAFIESAKQESIDTILDAAWLKQKQLKAIIVTGCMAERYRDEVMSGMPEVDAVVGCGSIHEIVHAVEEVEKGHTFTSYLPMESLDLGGERVITTPEYMAYLKIAEGCDNRCTYCAIPMIRGGFRSRTIDSLVAEAKSLEKCGVQELVLVAQDTTRYGIDLTGKYELPALIDTICRETQIPWIRLLYCYPDKITEELVATIRDNPRVVKYIDLPVQHISDHVLRRMNRHGGRAQIVDAVMRLRREIPDIVIRTTAIVGFPGETEEDFIELCAFVKETKFDRLGVFPYSQEEGTPAAEFEDQIEEQVKQDRCDTLMSIQLEITQAQNERMIGTKRTVLCEGYDVVAESYYGRSYADAPDVDGKVYFSSARKLAEGEFVTVEITEVLDYDLVGRVI